MNSPLVAGSQNTSPGRRRRLRPSHVFSEGHPHSWISAEGEPRVKLTKCNVYALSFDLSPCWAARQVVASTLAAVSAKTKCVRRLISGSAESGAAPPRRAQNRTGHARSKAYLCGWECAARYGKLPSEKLQKHFRQAEAVTCGLPFWLAPLCRRHNTATRENGRRNKHRRALVCGSGNRCELQELPANSLDEPLER
jgi:hypothetical protein